MRNSSNYWNLATTVGRYFYVGVQVGVVNMKYNAIMMKNTVISLAFLK